MLTPNTILQGRYRIVRRLGQGGMGTVYEAMDQRLSSVVAIKETFTATQEEGQSFAHEASLLANLRFPSLPNVIDHFAEGDRQYLVMQFIPGEDLAQLLELRQRAFAVSDVTRWGDELLKALEYLHAHNPPILHRDIKPSNLKLTPAGELFLIDFGLAKGAAGQMATLLTSRSVKGYTPVYAPLEQIHGVGTDPRSDLYSLAAALYHLITGRPPIDSPTRFAALDEDHPDPLPRADHLNPDVPAAVADVLAQAMAMNRKNRPANATEMRRSLSDAARLSNEVKSETPIAAPAAIPPTMPAPNSSQDAVPPTQPAQGWTGSYAPTPPRQPTVKEIPNLVYRPPANVLSGGPAVETTHPRKRKLPALAIVGLIAVLGFFALVVAAAVIAPAVLHRLRSANTNAPNAGSINSNTQVIANEPPTSSEPPKRMILGDFDSGKALELIYGNFDPKKKYAKWIVTKEEAENLQKLGSGISGTVFTSSASAQKYQYTEGGIQKLLFITATAPPRFDCHACAPLVGGGLFSKTNDGWQLDSETKYITTMGSYGSIPTGKLVPIGPDRQGIVFHQGYLAQGIQGEGVVIIGYTNATLRELISINEYGGNNEGAGCRDTSGGSGDSGAGSDTSEFSMPCYSYSSKIDFKAGANPDYYDLVVVTTGTRLGDDDKIHRANATKRYTFTPDGYVAAR